MAALNRWTRRAAMAAGIAAALRHPARAEPDYPARPIQLVVPYTPGGGTDLTAREVSAALTAELGQQVVILNRPGAATIVGSQIVAEARPDGYTLLMASLPLVANPSLYRTLPYDTQSALAPISLVNNAPVIVVANPSLPVKTAADLVAYCKANPEAVNYASFGVGSGAHLAAELFQSITGTRLFHIPYDGGGPAATAVISGEAQLLFSSLVPVLGSVRGGLMRPIGLASDKRLPLIPDVPTFQESGIPYEDGTWFGLLAPKATPAPVIARLSAALTKAAADPDLKKQMEAQGTELIASTPAQFDAFIHAETARWATVIARAGIKPQ